MSNTRLGKNAVMASCTAVCSLLDGGVFQYWAGPVPGGAESPLGTQHTLLAELTFGTPAFKPTTYTPGTPPDITIDISANAQANPISPDLNANATGVPTFFRCLARGDGGVVCQGTVSTGGTGAGDVVVDLTQILQHAVVTLPQFSFTAGDSCP